MNPLKFAACLEDLRSWAAKLKRGERAVMYGSVARGIARGESDLDLFLVAPRARHDALAQELFLLGARHDVTISPFLVERSGLAGLDRQFLESVTRDGVALKGLPLDPTVRDAGPPTPLPCDPLPGPPRPEDEGEARERTLRISDLAPIQEGEVRDGSRGVPEPRRREEARTRDGARAREGVAGPGGLDPEVPGEAMGVHGVGAGAVKAVEASVESERTSTRYFHRPRAIGHRSLHPLEHGALGLEERLRRQDG